MKVFLTKIILLALILIGVYAFFVHKLAQGPVDDYYFKFTQESQSIVLGLSRAYSGISPSEFDTEISKYGPYAPLTNFALEKFQSPFGETYLNAVKAKIQKKDKPIISLVCVSPGSLTAPVDMDNNQIQESDKKSKLGKVSDYTSYPNYSYIIENYGGALYNALLPEPKNNGQIIVHRNGWREFKLNSKAYDVNEKDIEFNKSFVIKLHKELENTEQKSHYRVQSLINTIDFLQSKGKVFIIRMPADHDIITLENQHWTGFDSFIDSISAAKRTHYLNYSTSEHSFQTYDGSHLHSKSAKEFSRILANDIGNILSK